MFEIRVGELRATFLRNHNMRRHKDPSRRQPKPKRHPKRKTSQAQKTPATPTTATSTGALHPIWGGAPVTWRCTRTEEVHCLRIGCSAPTHKKKRGTGIPNHSPPHPSMRTWALLAAGWARRPRRHLHSGPLRPTPAQSDTSYTLTCKEPDNLSAKTKPIRERPDNKAIRASPHARGTPSDATRPCPTPEARPATQHAPSPTPQHAKARRPTRGRRASSMTSANQEPWIVTATS